jgi:hypothetical protein
MRNGILGTFLAISLAAACVDQGYVKKEIEKSEKKNNERIGELEKLFDRLDSRVGTGNKDFILLDTATANQFYPLRTNVGTIFVSLKNVTPYLDGYKMNLQIGNPFSITLEGLTINATWSGLSKAKTFETTKQIFPGKWNNVELILSPATANDVHYINVWMDVKRVVLRADR